MEQAGSCVYAEHSLTAVPRNNLFALVDATGIHDSGEQHQGEHPHPDQQRRIIHRCSCIHRCAVGIQHLALPNLRIPAPSWLSLRVVWDSCAISRGRTAACPCPAANSQLDTLVDQLPPEVREAAAAAGAAAVSGLHDLSGRDPTLTAAALGVGLGVPALLAWSATYGGYSGSLAPAAALSMLQTEDALLVDIRTGRRVLFEGPCACTHSLFPRRGRACLCHETCWQHTSGAWDLMPNYVMFVCESRTEPCDSALLACRGAASAAGGAGAEAWRAGQG